MTHADRSLFAPFTLDPHRLQNCIVLERGHSGRHAVRTHAPVPTSSRIDRLRFWGDSQTIQSSFASGAKARRTQTWARTTSSSVSQSK